MNRLSTAVRERSTPSMNVMPTRRWTAALLLIVGAILACRSTQAVPVTNGLGGERLIQEVPEPARGPNA